MTNVRSWQFWVIIALALATMACAGRRERREERRERAEQQRAERAELLAQRRAQREAQSQPRAVEEPAPPPAAPALVATSSAPAPAAAAVADATSQVVFMRVSKQSAGTTAALFDVTEPGEPKYIGTVGPSTKLSYALKPGLYTFMAVGDTAEFMQAAIVGGRTYYALVIPRSGAKRFTIEPVRRDELGGTEFAGWDRGTRIASGAARSQAYDAADAADKRSRYWTQWSKKSEAQRAELTLNAEDGR